jgi:pimeloyl-ACP methyl ester carboxylesterase
MVRYTYILLLVVGLAVVSGLLLINLGEERNYISEEVEFSASDGIRINSNWYIPQEAEGPFKTVILVHQFDGDLHEWDPFVSDFIERGYAVLAYDIRSFGKSESVPRSEEFFDSLIKDVEGAISWLKNREDVLSNRIGIVGAQLGGTIAYAASAYIDDVKVAVAISPASDVGSLLIGEGQDSFKPNSILFQYLDTERVNIQPLIDKTDDPKTVRLYRPESPAVRASGIALLHRDLRAFSDLLRYLDENL